MKKVLLFIVTTLAYSGVFGQILKPVSWSYSLKKTSKYNAIIYLKASIDKGWHIYAQDIEKGGPVKTTITFKPSDRFHLLGKTTQPSPKTKFEKIFNRDIGYFQDTVIFQQKISVKSKNLQIEGNIKFMACDDIKCLPPENVSFSVVVN